jgi:hypothetical protein
MTFTCTTCGAEHDLDSVSFGSDAPYQWAMLSEEERNRSELGGNNVSSRHVTARTISFVPAWRYQLLGAKRLFRGAFGAR